MFRLASLLTLLCSLNAVSSPAQAVVAASADILKVPEHDRKFCRYQTLYHITDLVERANFLNVHAYQVNSLSRMPKLVKSSERLIAPDLLRLDIREYKWNPEVYDKLANVDPYFHILLTGKEEKEVEKLVDAKWPGGVWKIEDGGDGKDYPEGMPYKKKVKVKEFVATKKTITTNPFWVDPDKYKILVEQTQCKTPILRADWFLIQTGINEARVAGYYAFLELKNREDFEKLIGVNRKDADAKLRELAEVIKQSGVARLPRRVMRLVARDFGWWFTMDVLFKATEEKNALNKLDDDLEHDAEEHFGFLVNGLFTYLLCNNKGVLQDTAPPQIGPDTSSTNEKDPIHVFKGCVTCHVEGLRPLDKGFIRKNFQPPKVLAVADKNKTPEENKAFFERLEQLYLRPLDRWYLRDNNDFARTLAELNGNTWTTQKNASSYGQMWKKWAEDEVTLDQAVQEMGDGLTRKLLIEALEKYEAPVASGGLGRSLPPSVSTFVKEPMRREHFEEAFPLLQAVVRGIVFEDAIKEHKP